MEFLISEAQDFISHTKYRTDIIIRKLGMSKRDFQMLLHKNGLKFSRDGAFLSEETVNGLSKIFANSVQRQYDSFLKKRNYFDDEAIEYKENFFLQFVKIDGHIYDLHSKNWELDEEQIIQAFYRLILSTSPRRDNGSKLHEALLRRMISLAGIYISATRDFLSSIIPPKLFFTYTDEEDSFSVASNQTGFAVAGN